MRLAYVSLAGALVLASCAQKSSEHASHSSDHASHASEGHGADTSAGAAQGHTMHGTPAPDLAPGETRDFGQAPPVEGEALSVAQLLERCGGTADSCVVDGQLGASCTSTGCWSILSGPSAEDIVFVEMRDESFTFPKNAAGVQGRLVGTLARGSFSVAEANYYRTQTARVLGVDAPARAEAPVDGWIFTIDGARLTKAP